MAYAEYFVDTLASNLTGIPLLPDDGVFDTENEYLTGRIDLSELSLGRHQLYVHVEDIDQNWSEIYEISFDIVAEEYKSNWKFYGSDLLHDGYNRYDSLKIPLGLKWTKQLSQHGMNFLTVVNGLVFAATLNYSDGKICSALDLENGILKWQYDFGNIYSVSPPSFQGGYLMFQSNNHESDSYLYTFDLHGNLKRQTPFQPQWAEYLPPVTFDDKVLVPYYGMMQTGFKAFSIITGEEIWDYHPSVVYFNEYPAIYDSIVYLYSQTQLDAVDLDSGTQLWKVQDIPFTSPYTLDHEMPVIDASSGIILVTSIKFINAISISSRSLLWSISGDFSMQPAVKDGKVYVVNNDILEMYDAFSGDLLTSFLLNRHIIYPPAILNDNIFASSNTHLYALDPDDLSVKWSYPVGGQITIANNNLLLSASNGVIYCFMYDPTAVVTEISTSPDNFNLMQNYPNPFNAQTAILYSLPERSFITIKLFDVLGKEIAVLYKGESEKGTYQLNYNAENLPSGVYLYQLKADHFLETKKLILLK